MKRHVDLYFETKTNNHKDNEMLHQAISYPKKQKEVLNAANFKHYGMMFLNAIHLNINIGLSIYSSLAFQEVALYYRYNISYYALAIFWIYVQENVNFLLI